MAGAATRSSGCRVTPVHRNEAPAETITSCTGVVYSRLQHWWAAEDQWDSAPPTNMVYEWHPSNLVAISGLGGCFGWYHNSSSLFKLQDTLARKNQGALGSVQCLPVVCTYQKAAIGSTPYVRFIQNPNWFYMLSCDTRWASVKKQAWRRTRFSLDGPSTPPLMAINNNEKRGGGKVERIPWGECNTVRTIAAKPSRHISVYLSIYIFVHCTSGKGL